MNNIFEIDDDEKMIDLDVIKIFGMVKENNSIIGYMEFKLVNYDMETYSLQYECILPTDDIINDDNKQIDIINIG